jgi:DNA-binding transcriptional ArsR family regulator
MRQLHVSPRQCAKIFRVIGDDTRYRIVRILLDGEQCVSDLVCMVESSQPHVSHHLRVLREAGIVEGIRDGQRICYRLRPVIQERLTGSRQEGLDFGCCKISFSHTAQAHKV